MTSRLGAMIVSPITQTFGPTHANILLMGITFFYLEETLGKDMKDDIPEVTGTTSFVQKDVLLSSGNLKYDVISVNTETMSHQSSVRYFNKDNIN